MLTRVLGRWARVLAFLFRLSTAVATTTTTEEGVVGHAASSTRRMLFPDAEAGATGRPAGRVRPCESITGPKAGCRPCGRLG